MKTTVCQLLTLTLLFAGLVASGCGDDDEGGAVSPTTSSRPSVDEAELARDASLHVTPEQVVIFHLDPKPAGADLVKHTIRYLVRKTAALRFCIPADEPHLRRLELVGSAGKTLMRAERGDDCASATIPAGTYELHVFHEGAQIPAQGRTAFLHRPPHRAPGGGAATTPFVVPDFMAFRYGGEFVTDLNLASSCNAPLRAAGGDVLDLHSVFRVLGPPPYGLNDGTGATVVYTFQPKPQQSTTGPKSQISVMPASNSCGWYLLEADLEFLDGGNGQFSICRSDGGCLIVDATQSTWPYPSSLILSNGVGSTFTVDYKGYDCTTACDSSTLPLQEGEVALFGQENYQGPAFVFRTDVPNFSIYNAVTSQGLAIGDNMVQSVRVGPNTLAYLYQDPNYGGVSIGVGVDVPSLAGTVVGDGAVSSMHINAFGDYVLATKTCENCILTGADLHGLDLAGVDFSGARFSNANLTGTNFQSARLDQASFTGSATNPTNLSGTEFTSASLKCADFSGADLTNTQFGSLVGPLLVVDEVAASIFKTDSISGDRHEVSGSGVGSGTPFEHPFRVALASDGTLFVADASIGVLRVEPTTGARTVVWSSSSASQIGIPVDVAIDSAGQLLVLGHAGVAQVNPVSGTSMLVSGSTRGTGTSLLAPQGIAIDGTGRLIVADFLATALIAIDPSSGNRSILSNDFVSPTDVTSDRQGNLFVTDLTEPSASVFKVDQSGNRTLVSGPGRGTGPQFDDVLGIAVAWDGTLFMSNYNHPAVVRVDPTTGNRTIISAASTGSGPEYWSTWGLATIPTLAFDFSCRLTANGATIDAAPETQTFPLPSWRYMDLTNAKIANATAAPLSTTSAPLDLSGAILNGATGLNGACLDGVNLGCATPQDSTNYNCAQLNGTNLANASMKSANAASASLLGATLTGVNLENANLSSAVLGPCVSDPGPTCLTGTGKAATMYGAYMPNVNLSSAQLCSVDLSNAYLYSAEGGTTSLGNAALTSAKLNNAISYGVDFTGAALQCADLEQATLVNSTFDKADMTNASFDGSDLRGANFQGATSLQDANFTNAIISSTKGGVSFDPPNGGTLINYEYGATGLGGLATDESVTCPSGDPGPCVGAKLTPQSAPNGSPTPIPTCKALPPNFNNCMTPSPTPAQ